jgi:hypothetical protein
MGEDNQEATEEAE